MEGFSQHLHEEHAVSDHCPGGQNLQAVQLPLGSERPDGHCHTTRADSQSGGNIQTTGSSPSLGHSRKKPRGHQGKPRGFPPQGVRKPIQKGPSVRQTLGLLF